MNCNLKTFPTRRRETVKEGRTKVEVVSLIIPSEGDYEIWKETFEKEVREMRRKLEKPIFKGPEGYDVTRCKITLDEILGEEKS